MKMCAKVKNKMLLQYLSQLLSGIQHLVETFHSCRKGPQITTKE